MKGNTDITTSTVRSIALLASSAALVALAPASHAQFLYSCASCLETWSEEHDNACHFHMVKCSSRTSSRNLTTIATPWIDIPLDGPGVCTNCCGLSFIEPAPGQACPCASGGSIVCTPNPNPETDTDQYCVTVEFGTNVDIGAGGVSIGGFTFTKSEQQCRTRFYRNPCPPRTIAPCKQNRHQTPQRTVTRTDDVTMEVDAQRTIVALDPDRCKRFGPDQETICSHITYTKTWTEIQWEMGDLQRESVFQPAAVNGRKECFQ